jgi:hypothetical protein
MSKKEETRSATESIKMDTTASIRNIVVDSMNVRTTAAVEEILRRQTDEIGLMQVRQLLDLHIGAMAAFDAWWQGIYNRRLPTAEMIQYDLKKYDEVVLKVKDRSILEIADLREEAEELGLEVEDMEDRWYVGQKSELNKEKL